VSYRFEWVNRFEKRRSSRSLRNSEDIFQQ
jgi:hypothetical protein